MITSTMIIEDLRVGIACRTPLCSSAQARGQSGQRPVYTYIYIYIERERYATANTTTTNNHTISLSATTTTTTTTSTLMAVPGLGV